MLQLIQRCDVLAGRITIIRHVCCPLRVTSVTPPSHPVGVIRSPRRPCDVLLCLWSNLLCYRPDVVAWSVGYAVIYNIFKEGLSAEGFLSICSKKISYIVIRTRCVVSECVLECIFMKPSTRLNLFPEMTSTLFEGGNAFSTKKHPILTHCWLRVHPIFYLFKSICVFCVFLLSSCSFLDILHCLPCAVGVPLESALNLVSAWVLVGLMILTLAVLGVTFTCSICYDRADDPSIHRGTYHILESTWSTTCSASLPKALVCSVYIYVCVCLPSASNY